MSDEQDREVCEHIHGALVKHNWSCACAVIATARAQDRARIAELEAALAKSTAYLITQGERINNLKLAQADEGRKRAQAEKERDDWRTDARNYALRSGQAEERVQAQDEALRETAAFVVKILERVRVLEEALRRIERAEGGYSLDPLAHAVNCIEGMQALAREALLSPPAEPRYGPGCGCGIDMDSGVGVTCAKHTPAEQEPKR